jgi:hypothetical protein
VDLAIVLHGFPRTTRAPGMFRRAHTLLMSRRETSKNTTLAFGIRPFKIDYVRDPKAFGWSLFGGRARFPICISGLVRKLQFRLLKQRGRLGGRVLPATCKPNSSSLPFRKFRLQRDFNKNCRIIIRKTLGTRIVCRDLPRKDNGSTSKLVVFFLPNKIRVPLCQNSPCLLTRLCHHYQNSTSCQVIVRRKSTMLG